MKETVLYNRHLDAGAKFGDFGGYKMPLWFGSSKKEHLNVLNSVGLFDTSHMSLIAITGNSAYSLLNKAFTRDLKTVKPGRAVYGFFLNTDGTLIDDALIYVNSKDSFFIVVNAGMNNEVINHLNKLKYQEYKVVDYTDQLGKIDIQGPRSLELMEMVFCSSLFDKFPYFSYKGSLLQGDVAFNDEPVIISRSGYTGEFGFEIFINRDFAGDLWDTLMDKGQDLGISPCGLAARDSLRVGANLPLSHQDIGNWPINNTPWDFAISPDKDDYIGKKALDNSSYTYAYKGFDVRKLRAPDKGKVFLDKEEVGRVLTCITEPSLGDKGLCAGFIWADRDLPIGTDLCLSDDSREIKVQTTMELRKNRTARKSIDYIRSLK